MQPQPSASFPTTNKLFSASGRGFQDRKTRKLPNEGVEADPVEKADDLAR